MKKPVLYIHGGSSYANYEDYLYDLQHKKLWSRADTEPAKKWPSTLREQLGAAYEVFSPAMPNSDNAKYVEWKLWFERHLEFIDGPVMLVGWSQGGMFLMKYLTTEEVSFPIKALFLLAAPLTPMITSGSREDGGDFYPDTGALGRLASLTDQIHILHSTDDFVVPYSHAEALQAALPEATLHTFTDKNHFLVPELPELVQLIKTVA